MTLLRLCCVFVLAGLFLLEWNTILVKEYQIITQSLEYVLLW